MKPRRRRTSPRNQFFSRCRPQGARRISEALLVGWPLDVLPIVASPTHGTVELPWRLVGMGDNALYIAVYTRCGGSQPTSAWTEDTLTHLTLHVVGTDAATKTSSFTVTVWEFIWRLHWAPGCYAAPQGTHMNIRPGAISGPNNHLQRRWVNTWHTCPRPAPSLANRFSGGGISGPEPLGSRDLAPGLNDLAAYVAARGSHRACPGQPRHGPRPRRRLGRRAHRSPGPSRSPILGSPWCWSRGPDTTARSRAVAYA